MQQSEVERNKRYGKVKHMLEALPPVELIRNIREADDLPRLSLYGALETYIQGSSDCIFHAAFSVEMALLLRLDKLLTLAEKEKLRKETVGKSTGLMFSRVIKTATEKGILKRLNVERAWTLNNLRNIIAHPGNSVVFIKQQYEAALHLEKQMPDIYAIMEEKAKSIKLPEDKETTQKKFEFIQQISNQYVKQRLDRLPDLDWCASQDTLRFQNKRAKEYYKETSKRLLSSKGIEQLLENAPNIVAYLQTTYAYSGRDEIGALNCAYSILRSLRIISRNNQHTP